LIVEQAKWPNFFVVGAPKAATTSLYYYLKNIPQVYMSPIKEPSFFSPRTVKGAGLLDVVKSKQEYLRLFDSASGFYAVGEASPTYLWDPDVPKLIHEAVPNAKIIAILRDPIERAYSQYLEKIKYSGSKISFYDELIRDRQIKERIYPISKLYVEFGMYFDQVKRYFDQFGKPNVKVIIFEEFISHPMDTVNEILEFLGIAFRTDEVVGKYNAYSAPRGGISIVPYVFFRWLRAKNPRLAMMILKLLPDYLTEILPEKLLFKKSDRPQIEDRAIEFLRGIYLEEVAKLETLLGRPVPWKTLKGNL